MHGIIFVELRKFATAVMGPNAWNDLLKTAGTEVTAA